MPVPIGVGIGIDLVIAGLLIGATRLLTPGRLPHAPPVLVTALRRVLTSAVLLVGAFVCLELLRVIQVPAWAIALWPLLIAALLGGLVSNLITPLVPGVLTLSFRRYRVGDYIVIGNSVPPIAEGTVTRIDLYATHLLNARGTPSVPNALCQTQPVTRMKPPRPDA